MKPEIVATEILHKGFTTLMALTVRLPDGTEVQREIEDHGFAVAVLPYDPERRIAWLIKQLRVPLLLKGVETEMLEVPAGLLDEEDPEEAARREAMEEVGLRLETLEHVATAWASPGLACERVALYLAPCSAADRLSDGGGLADEHEHITVVEMPLDGLWSMLESGGIADMKTLTLLFALRHRHPELFAG